MIRIILDTDLGMGEPGTEIDDGFAFALAQADPEIQIDLVTTVNGNTDVETATLLTLELADRLGRSDIPIVKGATAPMTRPDRERHAPDAIVAKYGHRAPASGYAASAIVDHVMANPGEITIVAIGPLTNIAAAMLLEPRLACTVKEIVIMGGVFLSQTFQSSMPGEFNVWVDPEAAHALLHSGAKVRWVGLDVTLKVRLTRDHARQMQESAGSFASFAGDYTTTWIDHMQERHPGDAEHADSCAMHDPLAVAVISHPDFVTWKPAYVDIVIGDGIARGVMITDLLSSADAPAPNCSIAVDVDADGFMSYFLTAVNSL